MTPSVVDLQLQGNGMVISVNNNINQLYDLLSRAATLSMDLDLDQQFRAIALRRRIQDSIVEADRYRFWVAYGHLPEEVGGYGEEMHWGPSSGRVSSDKQSHFWIPQHSAHH